MAAADEDALNLADQAKTEKRVESGWRTFGELAVAHSALRFGEPSIDDVRLSVDARYEAALGPAWRVVLSDRFDATRGNQTPRQHNVNTLREAYLSWHARPETIVDFGRVNLRYGAGYGYNPTDFFKAGALRSIVSLDPAMLRENRQGTFVVQAQQLWTGGALSAAYSPRLSRDGPSPHALSLDLGATNPEHRWLLSASHKLGDSVTPQLVLFGGDGVATQTGINVSALMSKATVAFAEAAFGKGPALTSRMLGTGAAEQSRRRWTLGFTHTTAFNLALTAEAEYDGAAPDRAEWNALVSGSSGRALSLLALADSLQDLPTRRALFVHARWQDALTPGLDLSGFVRRESATRSQSRWLEARYRWRRDAEWALQWLSYSGAIDSAYGSLPVSHGVTVALRVYR